MNNSAFTTPAKFGRSMRSEFLFEEGYISLNHGSYGTFPKSVFEAFRNFQERAESAPDKWLRQDLALELDKARTQVAAFVNADINEIVFVQNTTTAINAVLKSLSYQEGDKLLFFSTAYKAIRELLYFIRDTNGGKVSLIEIEVTYPISDDDLIAQITKRIEAEHQNPKSRIKLAVIDAISSNPGLLSLSPGLKPYRKLRIKTEYPELLLGVIVPFQRIIPLLKQHNILSVIDGAHSIGQIPLNLRALDPDYFATNCHKWLYTVRGSAILYAPFRNQRGLHHPITSAFYPQGFVDEFSWVGTQDFSSYLTITAALEFRQKIGGEALIQQYCHRLAWEGGCLVASILGTEVMGPESLVAHMVNVRLPVQDTPGVRQFVETQFLKILFKKYNCAVVVFEHGGIWWVRLSAQIYNDLSDFDYVGKTLKEIFSDGLIVNSSKL
ncbi:12800_t:CDS:2 [Ambispora leptoticha]|uniref:12800_t:CDS:1 n=1 Tax=Ambispora leptoticha TaxID=144679 RepID=A0A9N8WS28_9GLOM|nr:12800_t:CDS:2 [Ambispora leptoticha]